ncbi:DUF499 domain-containing protein [Paracraurococcus lichenis]|uniref:DUF499 domain-containing protein n=1 Tax=Paracraurococcus lichenis TaxID=3064888 RepID=A0ABT9EAJ6_9PROT|nr:DUF499 domain-containing protein [Paracraurococcus sp. LOR1-02]MDO9713172.1 DUF499 domain-containing protein [Paracraurococcus sp. LOR1-02]
MSTVRDLCVPHDSVLRADAEPDIEDISSVFAAARGDGQTFFDRTHVTGGMKQMFELGIARLDGRSPVGVYSLTQAMGGGKTHLMVSMGLIAQDPGLRTRVLDAAGVKAPNSFGTARVVTVSGRQPSDRFIWGEIAEQLGKGAEFRKFWENGPKPPGDGDWEALIGAEPVLIMLDELAPYLDQATAFKVGDANLSTLTTYALSNLLAAAIRLPRCMVVVSNLSGSYTGASKNIAQVVANLRDELRRGAKEITPVALNSGEIFDILRKRLFKSLPTADQIDRVATSYAKAMEEAVRSRIVAKGPEQYAEDVHRCYPFHPRMRDLVAMFRNHENWRQTRGLMGFVRAIVRDVWAQGRPNNVGLIGVQHMDLNNSDMRNEVLPLADLQESIAKDIADGGNSNAELVDRKLGHDAGTQVANVILCASLMRGIDAKAGLTREQVVECLVAPGRTAEEFTQAFDDLVKECWYLHRGEGEVVYFARQENITKRLQTEAERAPAPRIEEGIKRRLEEVFRPARARIYQAVLALPEMREIDLSGPRKLIVINPDHKTPPETAERLLSGLTDKNNFLIVTGSPTHFISIEGAMRRLYAAEKVLREMHRDDPLRDDVEDRRNTAEFDLLTQVETVYNRIWYPNRPPGQSGSLQEGKLELRTGRGTDGRSSLDGEAAIEAELIKRGKFEPDPEKKADSLIQRIAGNPETNMGGQLWPDGPSFNTIPWADIVTAARQNPRFVWLPPNGLEAVKRVAVTTGKWREPEPGKVRRGPFPVEKTRVSVTVEARHEDGSVMLAVQPLHAGQTPRIHAAEGTSVSEKDSELKELRFRTSALRMSFLAVDPKGVNPTGEPETWKNRITLQHTVAPVAEGKRIEIIARPGAAGIRYTTDASHPRNGGQVYDGPFVVTPAMATGGRVVVRALAVDGDIEGEETFEIPIAGSGTGVGLDTNVPPTLGEVVDEARPADLVLEFRQTSTEEFFALVDALKAASAEACVPLITVGTGPDACNMRFGSNLRMRGEAMAEAVAAVRSLVGQYNAVTTSNVRSVHFQTGRDLIAFVEKLRIDVGDPRQTVSQVRMDRAA